MWAYKQMADSRGVVGHYIVGVGEVYSYRKGRKERTGIPDLMVMTMHIEKLRKALANKDTLHECDSLEEMKHVICMYQLVD